MSDIWKVSGIARYSYFKKKAVLSPVMTILPVPHHSFEVDFGTPWDKEILQVIFINPLQ
jgi:hypothetical protein